MEKRKRSPQNVIRQDAEAEEYKSSYMERPQPRSTNSVVQYIVIALLVVASFLLGTLYTKVQYLEKSSTLTQVKDTGTTPGTPAPQPATPDVSNIPKINDKDHIQGNKNAQIALIEYSDLECPYCKQFHSTMLQVMKDYGDKVFWVYRHYPLDFHANAMKEAEASECVNELGGVDAFWKFIDAIYERTTSNGTGFALDKLAPLAVEVGVNQAKFTECLDSGKYTKTVTDMRDGGMKAGVQGTPGTIVMNIKTGKTSFIPGALPFDSVKQTLDSMLK
jgi:protein-disulfide isomerase